MKALLLALFITPAHAVDFAPDPYGNYYDFNSYMGYQSQQADQIYNDWQRDFSERQINTFGKSSIEREYDDLERRIYQLEINK